ncbi:MAG: hypothetical protein JJU34_10350 [Lunatimonas sp.]|nr:hypothetical protein [Lunatimonas sp.]
MYYATVNISTVYTIHSRGMVLPGKAWELQRFADGNFITLLKDNFKGITDRFNVTEFSRGDVVEFRLLHNAEENPWIRQGDTLGYINSNEEQRRYRQLQDELEVLQAELLFYTTGQKPEDIEVSWEKLKLAEQDLKTETLLFQRNQVLYEDSVISKREHEIFENTLKLKEAELQIRSAEYTSAITGDKPEQELLIRSKIIQTTNQLEKISERLSYFTVISPIDGILKKNIDLLPDRMQLTVWDTSRLAVVIPIEVFEKKFIKLGNEISFYSLSEKTYLTGKITSINNLVQQSNNKQVVFATAEVDENISLETLGELVEVKILGEEISLKEYVHRIINKTISR